MNEDFKNVKKKKQVLWNSGSEGNFLISNSSLYFFFQICKLLQIKTENDKITPHSNCDWPRINFGVVEKKEVKLVYQQIWRQTSTRFSVTAFNTIIKDSYWEIFFKHVIFTFCLPTHFLYKINIAVLFFNDRKSCGCPTPDLPIYKLYFFSAHIKVCQFVVHTWNLSQISLKSLKTISLKKVPNKSLRKTVKNSEAVCKTSTSSKSIIVGL